MLAAAQTNDNDHHPGRSGASHHLDLRYIWTISSVAALGGLLFGWDWVVIGGAKPFFEPFFNLAADRPAMEPLLPGGDAGPDDRGRRQRMGQQLRPRSVAWPARSSPAP